ncbi:hypothetical protein CTA2_7475 [Colletotrichum tanaceti]|nr:hypothetical protein CTA2_7475 [Colletotrichum tanaceti]
MSLARRFTGAKFSGQLMMGIISSGERVASSPGIVTQDYTASIAQVGTGLVNASKVLDYTTRLSLERGGGVALNDTANFAAKHTVAVTDNAAEAVAFSAEPAARFDTLDASDPNRLAKYPLAPKTMVPEVAIAGG